MGEELEELFGDGTEDADGGEDTPANADDAKADGEKGNEAPKDGESGPDDEKPDPEGDGDDDNGGEEPAEGEQKDDKDGNKGKKDDKFVPKKALDSEKRRRRELEARLRKLEEAENRRVADAEKASIPDPEKQPVEHAAYLAQQARFQSLNDRLNLSEHYARRDHGEEAVEAAFEWANAQMEADKSGEFSKKLFAHASPYDYAVQLHKEAQEAANAGSDKDPEYEEFLAWKQSRGQQGGDAKQVQSRQPNTPRRKPPTTLAGHTSAKASSAPAESGQDAFDKEFT